VKLVHAADLHIDSPLTGLERYEGAPVERIRGATRRAFEALVAMCLEEGADALLIAGDVFDGDWKDYSTGLFFARELARLRERAMPVYLVRGNHDAESQLSRKWTLPDNVRELSTRRPQTIVNDALGLAVHGQGYGTRQVTESLAASYPSAKAGLVNVGLLHTSMTGREGHAPYAPASIEMLAQKGYDYWALGHVHAREIVSEDPWIVFPGNLQGRHAKETGPKGASIVTFEDGRVTGVEHRALDVVRWAHLEIDASELAYGDDVVDAARRALEVAVREATEDAPRLLAARLTVRGRSAAHTALAADPARFEQAIRAAGYDFGDDVWLEKIRFRTEHEIDERALAERDDAIGQLLRAIERVRDDDAALLEHGRALAELASKLPDEVVEGEDGVRISDPTFLREVLDDVKGLLLPRLSGEGEA
jgi:DNA repair exonuclease SbcCD nuclease subunit